MSAGAISNPTDCASSLLSCFEASFLMNQCLLFSYNVVVEWYYLLVICSLFVVLKYEALAYKNRTACTV